MYQELLISVYMILYDSLLVKWSKIKIQPYILNFFVYTTTQLILPTFCEGGLCFVSFASNKCTEELVYNNPTTNVF